MKVLDVNVVLPAHRADHPDHDEARDWLDALLARREQFGVPWVVWWSFLRLASHPRIFEVPTPVDESLTFIAAIRRQPGHVAIGPGPRHHDVLQEVLDAGEASADLVPDAVLAAIATEHGGEIVSFDRDFARFPGLRWTRPHAPGAATV
jgi:uncharacterized protein